MRIKILIIGSIWVLTGCRHSGPSVDAPRKKPENAVAISNTRNDSDTAIKDDKFSLAIKSAKNFIIRAFDIGQNCHPFYFRQALKKLDQAASLNRNETISIIESDSLFDPARNYPLFLNTVYGYTFSTAPTIESYITNKVYQTSCPGSFYCSIRTLELLPDHTFEMTNHKNSEAFSDCLENPEIDNTKCNLEIDSTTGNWRVKNRELELLNLAGKRIRRIKIENPNSIDGLYFPDPNDGSTEAEDDYTNSCLYIPE